MRHLAKSTILCFSLMTAVGCSKSEAKEVPNINVKEDKQADEKARLEAEKYAALKAKRINTVKDPKLITSLYLKFHMQLSETLNKINPDGATSQHLQEFLKLYNEGKIKIAFITNSTSRGLQTEDDYSCPTIYLNSDFVDSGIISTLVHEFEHAKHNLLFGKDYWKNNPKLSELAGIFGSFYYENNLNVKKLPKFRKALYFGSAFKFYTEYKAFMKQIDAINEGVKDNVRPERNVNEVIETVANDYLINHGIVVDQDYVLVLAKIADNYSNPEEFLIKILGSDELNKYFQSLQ